jgi:hypothetical protein
MLRSLLRQPVLAATIALGSIVACSEGTSPTMAGVAGAYSASVFTTTTSGTTTNEIARGSSLTLLLSAQGTVTGSLVIPADGVDEDMAGTWSLNGSTVTFNQSADTFVRDMDFTFGSNGTLTGDQTFGSTRVQITLIRITGA